MVTTIAKLIEHRFGIPGEAGNDTAAEGELAAILNHRTHRRYTDQPVSDDLMQQVLAAGLSAPAKSDLQQVAIIRVEELAPWPRDLCEKLVDQYPNVEEVVWAQEEPKNMGAWAYMNRELQGLLAGSFHWSLVSRPLSASPATGSMKRHAAEQARIMADAFGKGT